MGETAVCASWEPKRGQMVASLPPTYWFYIDIGSGGLGGVMGDRFSPNLLGEWQVDCFVAYRGD